MKNLKSILVPAYQPIFDLEENRVSHFEALARIRTDNTGMGHIAFIAIAERYRFIHVIDLEMAALVLEEAKSHNHTVSINLSPLTVATCTHELVLLLASHIDVVPRLVVEITESEPVRDPDRLRHFLSIVRQMGGRYALDDYGHAQGFFTEDMVRFLGPDYLKLDGGVLDRAIFFNETTEVRSACAVAASIGAQVVAEFVDSDDKIAYMRECGIRYAQGKYYGLATRVEPFKCAVQFELEKNAA